MLFAHCSRFSSRGITLTRSHCKTKELSCGLLGPHSCRQYAVSSTAAHAPPFYRSRRPIYSHETGRISSAKPLPRTLTTAAAPAKGPERASDTSTNNSPTTQSQIRTLMRRVPHPVAIITSTDPNSTPDSAFRGMTVSSFNTVTLHPEPIVSFNVKFPSETLNAIRTSSQFLIHLLSPNESTATLARLFSGGNENLPPNEEERSFRFSSPESLDKKPHIESGEPPVLSLKPTTTATNTPSNTVDFPFIFRCEYLPQSISIGDHMVVLGKVTQILAHPDLSSEASAEAAVDHGDLCLTYADTKFWKMGEEISSSSLSSRSRK